MDREAIKLYTKCMDFAALKHSTQRRKDAVKTPYVNHPIGVAHILANEANETDLEMLMAALLHDTVEDTECTFDEIEENFGESVRKIVEDVTDDITLPRIEQKRLQIVRAKTISFKAKLIKLADKLYNLRGMEIETLEGWSKERTDEYFVWAKQVVDNLRGSNQQIEDELDKIFRSRKLMN